MIEVTHLTRYYGEFAALNDVSFTVQEGQIVGLLGLNGAGKSTTLKILAGLLLPSTGSVTLDGADIVKAPDQLRARIGYLPEDPPLYEDMTVREFVRYIGRLKGMTAAEVERRLPEVLQTAQLHGREDQVIGTLSHGYRKRVGIAQTIIHDPRLVILDEPISGLDPVQIVEMRKVIRNLAKGRAVMVSSHILSEVEQTCDWLLVLRDGKLVAQGTEDSLTSGLRTLRLDLEVRGDAAAVKALLSGLPYVADVDVRAPVDGHPAARVTLSEDRREDLVAAIVAAGLGLRSMAEASDALEELFLGLTASGEA